VAYRLGASSDSKGLESSTVLDDAAQLTSELFASSVVGLGQFP
jgi:hypothetical protein